MKHRSDEELRWKTLSSEYILKEPWMTVRKDCMQLPNGNINPAYWCLEYPDWINVIAITDDGKYVFERQYRHGLDIVEWEIPAGVVEKGEEPMHAAQRELMEETGFGGGEWELFMESRLQSECLQQYFPYLHRTWCAPYGPTAFR